MRRAALNLALALTAACGSGGQAQTVWTEDATWQTRDGQRPWGNPMGDWVDAAGRPLGAKAFASASAGKTRKGESQTLSFDVTDMVRRFGADFRLNTVQGSAVLAARESPDGDGPVLEVSGPGGERRLTPVADTELKRSARAWGDRPVMNPITGALIRFDQPADPSIRRARLTVTARRVYGYGVRIAVFRPAVTEAALPEAGAVAPVRLPTGAQQSREARDLTPGSPDSVHRRGGRTLAALRGADMNRPPFATVKGDVLVTAFQRDAQTAGKAMVDIPDAPTEAYMTVVLKIAEDFTAPGGKLPGLSNTGLGERGSALCEVDGQMVPRGGWGGRKANGCRWSARTQWRLLAGGVIQGGTYLYVVQPKSVFGIVDPWSKPMPRGRWFAYVEWVKLNDPARADGEIAYWLIDRQSAPGGERVQGAGGIRYRTVGSPQSAINEMWGDLFCGGTDCGPMPWPRSGLEIKRMAVTTGLPDMGAIQAELDRLNGGG